MRQDFSELVLFIVVNRQVFNFAESFCFIFSAKTCFIDYFRISIQFSCKIRTKNDKNCNNIKPTPRMLGSKVL